MKTTDLLSVVSDTAKRLGHEMRQAMLNNQPMTDLLVVDHLALMRRTSRHITTWLTDWRAGFISSPACRALRDAIGETSMLTVYESEGDKDHHILPITIMLSGIVTGSGGPLFALVQGMRTRHVLVQEDILKLMPLPLVIEICRHLSGDDPAKFIIAHLERLQAVGALTDLTTEAH